MPSEGQFTPDPRSPEVAPTVFYSNTTISGTGNPEGAVVAWPGAMYVDVSSSTLYQKNSGNGSATGWGAVSGGGGGGTGATYSGSGTPEGTQTGSPGNTYWDATNNVFYVKDTGVGTNTGWRELVA